MRVGPVQHLAFVEGDEALPEEYDGHHICVYLTEEGGRQYSQRKFVYSIVTRKVYTLMSFSVMGARRQGSNTP